MTEESKAIAEGTKSLIILGPPGEYSTSVINMSVDDDEYIGIIGAGAPALAEVAFELDISQGEQELGVIFIKDPVGDTCAIDAAIDLHIGAERSSKRGTDGFGVRAECFDMMTSGVVSGHELLKADQDVMLVFRL